MPIRGAAPAAAPVAAEAGWAGRVGLLRRRALPGEAVDFAALGFGETEAVALPVAAAAAPRHGGVRRSSVTVVRAAVGRRLRRHVPLALIFLALSLLALAWARPTAALTLPWARSTTLLAMDISRSMRVADVAPNRMVAAQQAAKAFLNEVPRHIEVGSITFAGTAQVAQQGTTDHCAITAAIDAIRMQYGTAIGNAIVTCLAGLFPDQGVDLGEMIFGPRGQAFGPSACDRAAAATRRVASPSR